MRSHPTLGLSSGRAPRAAPARGARPSRRVAVAPRAFSFESFFQSLSPKPAGPSNSARRAELVEELLELCARAPRRDPAAIEDEVEELVRFEGRG